MLLTTVSKGVSLSLPAFSDYTLLQPSHHLPQTTPRRINGLLARSVRELITFLLFYTYQPFSPADYSMLMVAEALGGSNTSQVLDLNLNDNSDVTPGYVIYENGQPQRVVIINYMNDGGSGAAAYTAFIHVGGVGGLADTTPTTVTVRYMAAPSVTEKQNITWANQTMGQQFNSDGRPQGEAVTETITCAPDTGCPIRVPAPGAALVFLSQTAQDESTNPSLTETFPTTFFSQGGPTADQAVLETSNGRGGPGEQGKPFGATSHGMVGQNSAMAAGGVSLALSVAMAVGAMMVGRMLTGAQ